MKRRPAKRPTITVEATYEPSEEARENLIELLCDLLKERQQARLADQRSTKTVVKYLTANDIAERLQVSRSTAYRIARECSHVRMGPMGRAVRVTEEALTQYLERRTVVPESATTANARTSRRATARHTSGTSDWLTPIVPRTKTRSPVR